MNERNRMLYENANKYRIHQDTLRWTLAAGYIGSFAASIGTLATNEPMGNEWLSVLLPVAFFVFGNVYLLILAVENWFYNLFADYIKECEDRLINDEDLRPLSAFGSEKGPTTTPFHPSFFFVLLLVTFGNSAYLVKSISSTVALLQPMTPAIFRLAGASLLAIVYIVICVQASRRWHRSVYKGLIERFQHLYDPIGRGRRGH